MRLNETFLVSEFLLKPNCEIIHAWLAKKWRKTKTKTGPALVVIAYLQAPLLLSRGVKVHRKEIVRISLNRVIGVLCTSPPCQ